MGGQHADEAACSIQLWCSTVLMQMAKLLAGQNRGHWQARTESTGLPEPSMCRHGACCCTGAMPQQVENRLSLFIRSWSLRVASCTGNTKQPHQAPDGGTRAACTSGMQCQSCIRRSSPVSSPLPLLSPCGSTWSKGGHTIAGTAAGHDCQQPIAS